MIVDWLKKGGRLFKIFSPPPNDIECATKTYSVFTDVSIIASDVIDIQNLGDYCHKNVAYFMMARKTTVPYFLD